MSSLSLARTLRLWQHALGESRISYVFFVLFRSISKLKKEKEIIFSRSRDSYEVVVVVVVQANENDKIKYGISSRQLKWKFALQKRQMKKDDREITFWCLDGECGAKWAHIVHSASVCRNIVYPGRSSMCRSQCRTGLVSHSHIWQKSVSDDEQGSGNGSTYERGEHNTIPRAAEARTHTQLATDNEKRRC